MTATNDASFRTELNAEQKAHETSMDDILASIRRIIADDDALPLSRRARAAAASPQGGSLPNGAAVPPQGAAANGAPSVADVPVSDAYVSLGQRLTRRAAPVEPEASLAPPQAILAPKAPLFKLRRFAPDVESAPRVSANEGVNNEVSAKEASVKQASPAQAEQIFDNAAAPALKLRPSLEAEKPFEPPSASAAPLAPPSAPAVESRFKIASLVFRAPAFTPAPEKPVVHDPVKAPPRESPAEPTEPPPRSEAPPATDAPPRIEEKSEPALLSPANGSRIGASFEALAESLLLRDPRMVERLTREMLRPMLKEWLDDHLPDVVERLVRAEIERVARGGG